MQCNTTTNAGCMQYCINTTCQKAPYDGHIWAFGILLVALNVVRMQHRKFIDRVLPVVL